jgi:aryl-alcohol dehydrogenase-like predicted oxidoreductase
MASAMTTKRLGKNGPLVPALGFGLMGLSGQYGTTDDDETRFTVLDRAYELGQRFWDTSDIYGDSEELLGKWFARTGKRDEIFLATKVAFFFTPEGGLGIRSDPAWIRERVEKSLKRLGTKIDLLYIHRLDGKTPVEDTIEAMVDLKKYD